MSAQHVDDDEKVVAEKPAGNDQSESVMLQFDQIDLHPDRAKAKKQSDKPDSDPTEKAEL